MIFGIPAGELAWLAGLIVAGGLVTGILAGLFGIGGGALIVPVLYEVFGVLNVPVEVRMQLCVGTSLAIIVPTTFRSYRAHRARGAVMDEIVRGVVAAGRRRRRHRRADRRVRARLGLPTRLRGDRAASSRSGC